MARLIGGIALSAVVLFFWGFLFWGLSPFPYQSWSIPKDEAMAAEALRNYFPTRGTYLIPSKTGDEKVMDERARKGPVAFVIMMTPEGRSIHDGGIMLRGFINNLIAIVLIAVQLFVFRATLSTFRERFALSLISAAAAVVLIDLGEAVWWDLPLAWKLWQASYSFSAWMIPAVILSLTLDRGSTKAIA